METRLYLDICFHALIGPLFTHPAHTSLSLTIGFKELNITIPILHMAEHAHFDLVQNNDTV